MKANLSKLTAFIAQSFQGPDGRASSKKLSAFWLMVLITFIVVNQQLISYLAVFRHINPSDNAIRLVSLSIDILFALLFAVLAIYGVRGMEQVASLKALNKKPDTVVVQKDNEVAINTDGKAE